MHWRPGGRGRRHPKRGGGGRRGNTWHETQTRAHLEKLRRKEREAKRRRKREKVAGAERWRQRQRWGERERGIVIDGKKGVETQRVRDRAESHTQSE